MLLTASLTVPTVACGVAEDDDDVVLQTTTGAAQAAWNEVLEALCEANTRCNFGFGPSDPSRCVTYYQRRSGFGPADAIAVDSAQLATCLTAFEQLDCSQGDRVFYDDHGLMQRTCIEAFQGTVAVGEVCYYDTECAGYAFCARDDGECEGTCQAPHGFCPGDVDAGEPEPPERLFCPPETYCDPTGPSCEPRKTAGQACENYDCAEAHTCIDGVCERDGDVGDSCADGRRCQQHAHCIDDVCIAGVFGLGVGESCGVVLRTCGNDLFCGPDEVCRPVSELGEPCDNDAQRCAADLFCASGVCQAPRAPGEACETNVFGECGSGVCADGVCVPREEGPSACVRPAP